MNKIIINTENAPGVIGPFNQGVVAGKLLFTSGQLPMHPRTGDVPDGVEAQTIQVMENLKAIVEAAGAGMQNIVKTTVYLQNMEDFAAVNEIYAGYFPATPPARACVEVSKMAKGALVEIDAIALLS